MTTKASKIVKFTPVTVASVRDAGCQAARTGDSLASIARWMGSNVAGFPDKISPEDRVAFKDGVFVHYTTVKATEYYVREGTNLVPCSKPAKFGPEHEVIDVARCTGMPAAEFGKLKATDRPLYDVVAAYRNDCNVYAGNRLRMVVGCYKALTSTPHARSANKSFHDGLTEVFEARFKSLKKRRADGDPTAPTDAVYRNAVKAFWKVIKDGTAS